MSTPALFLDRDGVINVDLGYVHRIEDVRFVDGIFELVATARRAGYLVVVVTNQSGIARGHYGEADFQRLMDWMREQFALRGGAVDAVYFCPCHPEGTVEAYRQSSAFRKPEPGMLLQAARDLDIDLPRSILVGDKASDIAAGRAAGVGTCLHLGPTEARGADAVILTLREALAYLARGGEPRPLP